MLVQGFPVGRVPYAEEVPDGFLQDLGGNMMTTLVALAVVQSTLFAIKWEEPQGAEPFGRTPSAPTSADRAEVEVDVAWALFQSLQP